jgi:hypothetical protein
MNESGNVGFDDCLRNSLGSIDVYIFKIEIPIIRERHKESLCFIIQADEIINSITVLYQTFDRIRISYIIFLSSMMITMNFECTCNMTIPKSPATLSGNAAVKSRYGTTTCVPCFASLLTRYLPRKPVAPNTVATCPESDDLYQSTP